MEEKRKELIEKLEKGLSDRMTILLAYMRRVEGNIKVNELNASFSARFSLVLKLSTIFTHIVFPL